MRRPINYAHKQDCSQFRLVLWLGYHQDLSARLKDRWARKARLHSYISLNQVEDNEGGLFIGLCYVHVV